MRPAMPPSFEKLKPPQARHARGGQAPQRCSPKHRARNAKCDRAASHLCAVESRRSEVVGLLAMPIIIDYLVSPKLSETWQAHRILRNQVPLLPSLRRELQDQAWSKMP